MEEAERSIHDALCVLSQTVQNVGTTYGGGCAEVLMATAVDKLGNETAGKRALAIKEFAQALRNMPMIIADNAGYDSTELVANLSAAHAAGDKTAGLDMENAKVGDMAAIGIVESFKLKRQVLLSASEAAEQILRVDDIIKCAPRQRQ